MSRWMQHVWDWKRPSNRVAEPIPTISNPSLITDTGNSGALAEKVLESLNEPGVERLGYSGKIKSDSPLRW